MAYTLQFYVCIYFRWTGALFLLLYLNGSPYTLASDVAMQLICKVTSLTTCIAANTPPFPTPTQLHPVTAEHDEVFTKNEQ